MLLRDSNLADAQKQKDAALFDWSHIPGSIDMGGYAPFYQGVLHKILERNEVAEKKTVVVEAGVRYGVSARIFMSELREWENWELHLCDPVPQEQATLLEGLDQRVKFHKTFAEGVAKILPDESVDLLHIDADYDGTHPYELSFGILFAYWKKLKPEGELLIHDCTDQFPGIMRLANELKASGWDSVHCEPDNACPIAAPVHLKRIPQEAQKPQITMVVPVVSDRWLVPLLKNIQTMTLKPKQILVIDNAGVAEGIGGKFRRLPVKRLPQDSNIGVNASWNLGLSEAKCELVAICNDDIVLPKNFFKAVQRAFMDYPQAGFVIPTTIGPMLRSGGRPPWKVGKPGDIKDCQVESNVVSVPQRQGGWCMTVRKSAVSKPIPSELHTFCGDDFLFRQIVRQGYWALKMTDVPIYHHVGVSQDLQMREDLKLPLTYKQEREAWERILREGNV